MDRVRFLKKRLDFERIRSGSRRMELQGRGGALYQEYLVLAHDWEEVDQKFKALGRGFYYGVVRMLKIKLMCLGGGLLDKGVDQGVLGRIGVLLINSDMGTFLGGEYIFKTLRCRSVGRSDL